MSIERAKKLRRTVNATAALFGIATFAAGAAFVLPHYLAERHDMSRAQALESPAFPGDVVSAKQQQEANAMFAAGERQSHITAQRALELGVPGLALVGLVEVGGLRKVEQITTTPPQPPALAAGPPPHY